MRKRNIQLYPLPIKLIFKIRQFYGNSSGPNPWDPEEIDTCWKRDDVEEYEAGDIRVFWR